MQALVSPKLPIETVNWNELVPTYPYRFKGPGYLYCVSCTHFIRMVSVSDDAVCCSDCAKVLANSTTSMSHGGKIQ